MAAAILAIVKYNTVYNVTREYVDFGSFCDIRSVFRIKIFQKLRKNYRALILPAFPYAL